MKKLFAIVLSVLMVTSMTACRPNNSSSDNDHNGNTTTTTESSTKLEGVSAPIDILNTVASSYTEDEKIPGEPTTVEDGDKDTLDAVLHCSDEASAMISSAAYYMHMMMANNFTAGSYQLKEDTDPQAFVSAIESSIKNTQWICGFPEKLVIATLGDEYVVAAFGAGDLIDNFKAKLTSAYSIADIAYDGTID